MKPKVSNPYLKLPALCYDRVNPTPLKEPTLLHLNQEVVNDLGLNSEFVESSEFVKFANGDLPLEGSDNFAMCYAGHQFGFFVPRLGDGRAINIGTYNNLHLQLKGAGQTLYSRQGDGRAVVRSSVREYLMSEAMHTLGIPTTRALAIIQSKQRVYRENWEETSMVLRVSPSWVRFGTLEYFANKKKYEELEAVIDYVIAESYPHLVDTTDLYLKLFTEIVEKTAKLLAQWQSVGFNHGVMNTDNMSIAGLSIDYGPYAFLDDYDTNFICNHTDRDGRYSFGNQPQIGQWNLQALMMAFSPLVPIAKMEKVLSTYGEIYSTEFLRIMGLKIGIEYIEEKDFALIKNMLEMLQLLHIDYTLFFRTLSHYQGERKALLKLCLYHQPMHDWLDDYDKRVDCNSFSKEERKEKMLKKNPKYVLKNYMIQEAIEGIENGDYKLFTALFEIAQTPYSEHTEYERWSKATPEEFKNQKLSCSS